VHTQAVQTQRLAIFIVACRRGQLVVVPPVVGKGHGGIGDQGSGGLCGDDVAQQDALAIRVGGVYRWEGACLEDVAQGAGCGGIGRGEEASAELAACAQAVFDLAVVSHERYGLCCAQAVAEGQGVARRPRKGECDGGVRLLPDGGPNVVRGDEERRGMTE
jgi:hypothetical protein